MDLDIARMAFGAYQAGQEKPVRIETHTKTNGEKYELIFGMVNPCIYGDQCEGHACYCNNDAAPYRKCRNSWFYGEKDADSKCEFFKPNPHWIDGDGDFYQQREITIESMKQKDLVELRDVSAENEGE